MLTTFSKIIIFLLLSVPVCIAQLVPINEGELSNVTGQSIIKIDTQGSNGGALDGRVEYTKITLGLDIETSLNADLVELGNYKRDLSGNIVGSTESGTAGADLRISDFALGKIDNAGNIIPFKIKDPFIELACQTDGDGLKTVAGVRFGFGEASGALSGNFESLTGDVNVDILDHGAGLSNASGALAQFASFLLGNNPISASASLVDSGGNSNQVRATQVGIPNNESFNFYANSFGTRFTLGAAIVVPGLDCIDGGFLSCSHARAIANNCTALGIDVCFDLSSYQTLDVGTESTPANGLFLSFQTKPINWYDKDSSGTFKATPTVSGAFFNVPNGGLTVNLTEALTGTARVRTKYVDPYFGGY
jgi:hypothetical protein